MSRPDLVLVNGVVLNPDSEKPIAEAIAISQGIITAVGSNEQVLSLMGEKTEKIDVDGRVIVPGFVDCHAHGAWLGQSLQEIDLRNATSINEIIEKVKRQAVNTPKGNWIIGHGWDQDKLSECRYPNRQDLDEAAPNNPVFLRRVCGHLGVVNSEAMKRAKISKDTTAPIGGKIDRAPKTGIPNGVIRENALDLVHKVIPERSESTLTNAIKIASKKMVQEGLTTIHWIIGSGKELRILQKLNSKDKLPLRVYVLIPVEYLDHLIDLGLTTGFGNDRIRIGSVKILADGSLGARTAALKTPYAGSPENKGMMLYSEEQLEELVEKTHKADLQLAIHVIGDRTAETVLKILKNTLRTNPRAEHRHRLEHASVLSPKLIQDIKETNVIVSVQPHFIVSDFWVRDRLGDERVRWTYALKSICKEGIIIVGGSDAPVEPISPILGIHAATTRKTVPEERLTVSEALKLYTINAAYASFEEDIKGTIEKGKLADLVVLSRTPFQASPEQLKLIVPVMTIVGGKIVYKRHQE
jgi:predicted amidohydrolase YtcJ